jgi:hypothetical protein
MGEVREERFDELEYHKKLALDSIERKLVIHMIEH